MDTLKENAFLEGIAVLSFKHFSILLLLWSDHDHSITAELDTFPENTLKMVELLS